MVNRSYKVLLYNVQNCNGIGNNLFEYVYNLHKYFYHSDKILKKISEVILNLKPDIVALNEIDFGSFRSKFINQLSFIYKRGNFKDYLYACRYKKFMGKFPFLRHQGSGFLSKEKSKQKLVQRFKNGFKSLILEMKTFEDITFILVHLSIRKGARQRQLSELLNILENKKGKIVLLGDFNIVGGIDELSKFMEENGLVMADCSATYPSWKPKKYLDLIFASKGVKIKNIKALDINLSDHLPLIFDVTVP